MRKSWCEVILALIILIFALWPTTYSKWAIAIAAAGLTIHSFICTKCLGSNHNKSIGSKPSEKKR